MNRPSFQFYPADWLRNGNLRRCSAAARGVWMDILCVLHDSEIYGVVRWTLADLANAVGSAIRYLRELVEKEVLKGCDEGICEPLVYIPRSGRKEGRAVDLIEAQPGPIWYSSRMVRDEYVRKRSGGGTRFGTKNGTEDHHGGGDRRSPGRRQGAAFRSPDSSPGHSPSRRHGEDQGEYQSDGASSSSSTLSFSLRSKESVARAPDPGPGMATAPPAGPDPPTTPTPAGEASLALRAAGVATVNGSDPRLLRLLAQGVTPRQLADVATELRERNGRAPAFALVLGTMAGRLSDAAAMPAVPAGTAQRVGRARPTAFDAVDAVAESIRRGVAQARGADSDAIDVEARDVG